MGNPVGSLEVPNVLHARKRLLLELSQRQKEILIGCVLGDAHISPLGKIRIEQSIHQREYVDWKYQELHSLCYGAQPREILHILPTGKQHTSVFFLLRQYFRSWRSIFYEGRIKIFPRNLPVSPLSLAVWYMDDGCWTGKKALICAESFDGIYRENMQRSFIDQYGIETVVGKNGRLVIRKKFHDQFFALISPYIIPSMKYKLP